ncbi:MAG TPA: S41 family peptidase [Chitinophagaceae bacterium]|nr:S41 family peptidase [Chitinophagaceae bacterium]
MRNRMCFLIASFFSWNSITAQDHPAPKIDVLARNNVIENICEAFTKNYVFPDKAKLICTYIKEQNVEKQYDSLSDPNAFANQLFRDIRSLSNDKHIRIEYDPQLEKDILAYTSSQKEAVRISAADIARDEKKNFYFKKLEILPSNIGYIEFTGFTNTDPAARKTINAVMQFVSHTDALIIDLRDNTGGSAVTANEIAGYFFNTRTYTGKTFNRIENKWTNQFIENKKEITNGLVLNMPVYILTGGRTFSAAEGLAYILQHIKKAIVIGDTTKGGAHLTRSFSLGKGFVGFIPFTREENAVTGTDWEGTGVIPDIATEEINSLGIAQNTILDKKLQAATNETEKRKLRWLINYNRSKEAWIMIDPVDAAKFTGRFAEFEILLRDGQLLFRDTNQPVITYKKMTAISSTLFQVGYDYQVEFIIENNGLCHSIRMYWDDGYEDKISRSGK